MAAAGCCPPARHSCGAAGPALRAPGADWSALPLARPGGAARGCGPSPPRPLPVGLKEEGGDGCCAPLFSYLCAELCAATGASLPAGLAASGYRHCCHRLGGRGGGAPRGRAVREEPAREQLRSVLGSPVLPGQLSSP